MYDYFEYVQFPKLQNVKMRYHSYRDKFLAQRHPERYLLNDEDYDYSEGNIPGVLYGIHLTGLYIGFYYYFVKKVSKSCHSRCNYILMKQIFPSSLVVFGLSFMLGRYISKDESAIRKHNIALETLMKRYEKEEFNDIYKDMANELKSSK